MNQDFRDRIREERNRLNLSQGELAVKAGVSQGGQSQIESGHKNPTMKYLLKLTLLGIDVNYIITGDRNTSKPEIQALANAFLNAPEAIQSSVCKLLDFDFDSIKK